MNSLEKEQIKITNDDFLFFQRMIKEMAGISLSSHKTHLVQSRLRSRIIKLGMEHFSDYRKYLQTLNEDHEEWQIFVNQMTTNKTEWFREEEHFRILIEEYLPQWLKLKKQYLKVWCAASSSGEEAYSLALCLDSFFKNTDISFEIVATDIDTNVLNWAKSGVYPKEHLLTIPEHYHSRGFDFGTKEISSWVRVNKRIKDKITFEKFNLAQNQYPWKEKFDVIFCRNVLIYFNKTTIRSVVENSFSAASENAALFIAHSESLQNVETSWRYFRPSIYFKGTNLLSKTNLFHKITVVPE